MESKLTHAVLKKIRARAEDYPASAWNIPFDTPKGLGQKVSVREAEFSDFPEVSALGKRLGQGPDSVENWQRLWLENPAIQSGNAPARIGWVLEASGEVVGFLGSIPLLYEYEGKSLVASTTCRFAVDPAHRASSHLLMTSFLRQKDVDLLLNTTATPSAGKIMNALKAAELPQRSYGTVLFWVLNARQFVKVVLKKVGLYSVFYGVGGMLLKTESVVRRRMPSLRSRQHEILGFDIDKLGEDFDQFCAIQVHTTKRLMACRSGEIMRWHFCPPQGRRPAKVFCAYSETKLVGYVVVRSDVDESVGLRRSIIADLVVKNDDPAIVQSLIMAAHESATESGSFILELMGFPSAIRDAVTKWNPYSRQYPSCPFFFKAPNKTIQEKLLSENEWYASPYDGDATLWP
jgi:hypothetical protein